MDLIPWLEQESPDLYRAVMDVRAAVEPILGRPLHRHYTDHSVNHSDRVIKKLNDLTEGLMNSSQPLSPTEVYILLAAAYLHDIGMQDERSENADLGRIRDRHHVLTREIVLRSIEQSHSYEIRSLNLDPDDIARIVALVAASHQKVNLYQDKYGKVVFDGETIRPRLLAALLRFAHELDIDSTGIYPVDMFNLMNVPVESKLDWYKRYYVGKVEIKDEYVTVHYQFPERCENYRDLITPLVHDKIKAEHAGLQKIFREFWLGVTVKEPKVRYDVAGLERMPFEVEKLADQECSGLYGRPEKRVSIPEPFRSTTVSVHQPDAYFPADKTELRRLLNRIGMNPSFKKLAQLMQERRELGEPPYMLLLGPSLSLTPPVRCAFAGTENWEVFWEKMQYTSPTECKALLKKHLDALGLELGYQAIARLAEAGYFRLILTLNVDDTIDDAVRPLPADQSALLIYDGNNAAQIVTTLSHAEPRIKVVKLRGDINAQALSLIDTRQFEFPDDLERSISELLKRDTILVGDIPYDTDVQRCIRSGGALWCVLPDEPASDSFIKRARRSRPSGEIITGADADFNVFFTALAERLPFD